MEQGPFSIGRLKDAIESNNTVEVKRLLEWAEDHEQPVDMGGCLPVVLKAANAVIDAMVNNYIRRNWRQAGVIIAPKSVHDLAYQFYFDCNCLREFRKAKKEGYLVHLDNVLSRKEFDEMCTVPYNMYGPYDHNRRECEFACRDAQKFMGALQLEKFVE
jgi:hypothetical protein